MSSELQALTHHDVTVSLLITTVQTAARLCRARASCGRQERRSGRQPSGRRTKGGDGPTCSRAIAASPMDPAAMPASVRPDAFSKPGKGACHSHAMPSDLASYLAAAYLAADSKASAKKRKRKHDKPAGAAAAAGLLIRDDDDDDDDDDDRAWAKPSRAENGRDDDNVPVAVGAVREPRRKTTTTKANWKAVDGAGRASASASADEILAAAAAEDAAAAARAAEDESPAVVVVLDDGAARMADGTGAGLQSAAAVTAQLARQRCEERQQFEAERRARPDGDGQAETHYRDATGRRVDVSMRRAAARRALHEAEERARASKAALKGEVQAQQQRRHRELLEDAKTMPLARGADDDEINRALKEQRRWDDPIARFLPDTDRAGSRGGAITKSSKRGKPVYQAAAPPNRYGIRPGYRWDGVDRSNGYEADRFKAINRRERNKGLEYAWQMDE